MAGVAIPPPSPVRRRNRETGVWEVVPHDSSGSMPQAAALVGAADPFAAVLAGGPGGRPLSLSSGVAGGGVGLGAPGDKPRVTGDERDAALTFVAQQLLPTLAPSYSRCLGHGGVGWGGGSGALLGVGECLSFDALGPAAHSAPLASAGAVVMKAFYQECLYGMASYEACCLGGQIRSLLAEPAGWGDGGGVAIPAHSVLPPSL
jgi:hypothetical protein